MTSEYRPVDETANLITHGLGLILSVAASVYLMRIAIEGQHPRTVAACGIYCLTLVLLYAASTLSHAFYDVETRRIFRMLDQGAIFLMIAGSFTPFAMIFLTHGWWWTLLAAMWMLAFGGVLVVLRMRDLVGLAKLPYGIMGWLPVLSLWELYRRAPLEMLLWMVAGGAFYSLGAIFLTLDRKVRYFHALWHTFVMAGSMCHYIAIVVYIAPE